MFFATGAAFGKGALQHVFTGAVRLRVSVSTELEIYSAVYGD